MADSAPDFTVQQLLAICDRIDSLLSNIQMNVCGEYGGPTEQARRLQETKRLCAEVVSRLGYKPKSTRDKGLEDLNVKIKSIEPISDDFSVDLPHGRDLIFRGPRVDWYRINSNVRESCDVP